MSLRAAPLSRRSFLGLGAAAGLTALAGGSLAGCSWTPRSEEAAGNDGAGSGSAAENEGMHEMENVEGMALIEGGTFQMGSPDDEPWRGTDEDQHEVTVSSFYLSPYEVTQGQYAALMGSNPSAFQGEALPVENLTWFQAVAFCNALSASQGLDEAYAIDGETVTWDRAANGYRLPTEAEWEYACRAGTSTPFNVDHPVSADTEANYYGTYPYEIENNYFAQGNLETSPGIYRQRTVEPGSFPANAWGLFDMHGNVAEWVWDVYGPYDAAAAIDPVGAAEGSMRVNRGGGWNDFGKSLRSAYRASLAPDGASPSIGLRVARNAEAGTGTVGATAAAAAARGAAGGEALVVFFSWSGNTRGIAQEISRQTGIDAIELQLVRPYSSNYNTVLEESQRDQNAQARPELATRIDGMERYSTILLGYPNWWASIPMPIATFLESYDFAGKTIIPFCSHGGGRLGQSVTAIGKLAPQSAIGEPLSVHYSGGSALPDDVASWLAANGVA